jgi:single-strand DNA-binding protein
VNRVELVGGLVRDPELRAVGQSGTFICEVTLAVSGARFNPDTGTQEVNTVFPRVVAWEQLAEALEKFRQGDVVHIVGELDQRVIETKDGKQDTKTRVLVLTVQLVRVARRNAEVGF